ncbi:CU044_5270 family protein [Streptomyces sp. NPDC005648]|uniref:CU044_5270 family protein n=1 Tax=Streptomyces sp. NPDC005648 TaxID=3157044 RepID=UPI0033B8FD4F
MRDIDELRELRDFDAGAPPLDERTRARVRARLLRAAQKEATPVAVRRRRPVLRIALTGLVAAAVAGTVVVAVHDDESTRRVATPPAGSAPAMRNMSARTVLTKAAAYQRAHERQVAPRADQYIYTREIIKETEVGTGVTRSYVDENWVSVDQSKPSWVMEIGKGWWSPPPKKNESVWPTQDWSRLSKLPTDPDKLLLAMRNPTHPSTDDSTPITDDAWPMINFFLEGLLYRVPVMPPGLRAAAYEALGKIPGNMVTPHVKDARGRVGIGVTYSGRPSLGTMIFDPKTYAFLGFRNTRTSGDGKAMKTYIQLSYLDSWAIVDKVKVRPSTES